MQQISRRTWKSRSTSNTTRNRSNQRTKHTFQFHFNPYCRKGLVEFVQDDILDDVPPLTESSNISGSMIPTPSASHTKKHLQISKPATKSPKRMQLKTRTKHWKWKRPREKRKQTRHTLLGLSALMQALTCNRNSDCK